MYRSLMLVCPVSSMVKSLSVLLVESQRASGILVGIQLRPASQTREQGAALSEEQMNLRSNVTASQNA